MFFVFRSQLILLVTNLTQKRINSVFLQRVFEAAKKILGKKIEEVSLVLAGDDKIKEINKKYRRKNETTDVLSFEELNEIFISLPQAKKQAQERKIGLNCELTRLFVHGIVHLAGFDHEKSKTEAKKMEEIENKIISKI